MLLPPQFKEEPLKTLGPPIRKEQENKPVEVEVSPGIWRVNGKLETRFPVPVLPMPVVIDYATIQTEVSEVDIPLPEFKVGDRVRLKISSRGVYIFDETRCPPGTLATIIKGGLITDDGVEQLYINECVEHV